MSISQSTTHSFHMDEIMNVMYFEHDKSIYVDNPNDDAVQVHGVKTEHIISLCRNLFCARNKVQVEKLPPHSLSSLKELKEYFANLTLED
jgi:hypothetical protein